MPRANPLQTNFTGGEVSPLFLGQADNARYRNGAAIIDNFIVRAQGGIWRRSGTRFAGHTMSGGDFTLSHYKARLIPFFYSNVKSYVIEFGDQYIRFWNTDTSPVLRGAAVSISALTDASGLVKVTTGAAHGLDVADSVFISGQSNNYYNGSWNIVRDSATEFRLIGSFWQGDPGVGNRGTVDQIYKLASPYYAQAGLPPPSTTNKHVDSITYCQSADTLFLAHPEEKPRELRRIADNSWQLTTFDFVDGPYMPFDQNNIRLTYTPGTDSATLNATAAGEFVAGDVDDFVEFMYNGIWRIAKILTFVSGTEVTAQIIGLNKTITAFDPRVRLNAQTAPSAAASGYVQRVGQRPYNSSVSIPSGSTANNPSGNWSPGTVPGVSNSNTNSTANANSGLDPNNKITIAATTVSATHGGTFGPGDVGKYVRIGKNNWGLITAVTNDYTVTVTEYTTISAPYMVNVNSFTDAVTVKPNSRTIAGTLTSSAALFASTDVGRHVRLDYSGMKFWVKITAYSSSTSVTVNAYDDYPINPHDASQIINAGQTDLWQWGSWSDTTGWPWHVTFHENRLWFGATKSQPNWIWASRPDDYNAFSPTEPDGSVLDDNGMAYGIVARTGAVINFMESGSVLMLGTVSGEYQVRAASSVAEPITPSNINVTPQTTDGSRDNSMAVKIGPSILFIGRSGKKVNEITYSYELDSWQSRDMTAVAEHILRDGTGGKRLAWAQEPNRLVWVQLESGTLACLTYNREEQVFAWSRHSIGGGGIVENVCSVPVNNGEEHRIWMVVRRTISSVTRYQIEHFRLDHYPSNTTDKSGQWYVDGGNVETYSVDSGTSWNIWSHLEGKTISVSKNGVHLGNFTVSSGKVTGLSAALNGTMIGGLVFESTLKTLPIEGGSPFGSAMGKMKRIAKLDLRFLNTLNFRHGPDGTEAKYVNEDLTEDASYFTGDYQVNVDLTHTREGTYYINQNKPYPLIILALMPQVKTNE